MRPGLETELTAIELRVDENFHQDLVGPVDYQGPVLYAVAHAGRIVSLTAHGRVVRPLALDVAKVVVETAALAREEHVEPGVDTANGRTLTTLRVRVDSALGAAHSYSFSAAINHYAPRSLPAMWSALLVAMRDAIGELATDHAACWDCALTWVGPVDLGPPWHNRKAVRLPHLVTCIEPNGPLLIRSGQPTAPGAALAPYRARPSALYRLDPATPTRPVTLTCLDDHSIVSPDSSGWRWQLPCGAGVVTYRHEWREPPRVVLRVDDLERGLYVQRPHRP
ncbi:MAG TPA: hypothetical protein VIK91_01010 [Nannocystis sp.]